MEKPCTHDLARDILDRTKEEFGVPRMMLNKKDAERVTGMSRRQVQNIFRADKLLSYMDIARRMSASR